MSENKNNKAKSFAEIKSGDKMYFVELKECHVEEVNVIKVTHFDDYSDGYMHMSAHTVFTFSGGKHEVLVSDSDNTDTSRTRTWDFFATSRKEAEQFVINNYLETTKEITAYIDALTEKKNRILAEVENIKNKL